VHNASETLQGSWRQVATIEHPKETEKVRTLLKAIVLSLGLLVAGGAVRVSSAQQAPTREQVQAELSRVGQDVWHAKLTSDLNAQLYQTWSTGETAFSKGDYATAMKELKQADTMAKQDQTITEIRG
jgi:hypothetical protein